MTTDRLAELLESKHRVLRELHQLTCRQRAFIAEDAMPKLLNVLAAKQQRMLELQQLERDLAPFRQEDPELRVWRSPEQRRQSQEVAAACERLVAELVAWERESEATLRNRQEEIGTRLRGMHVATQAHAAYAQTHTQALEAVVSQSLDLSSES